MAQQIRDGNTGDLISIADRWRAPKCRQEALIMMRYLTKLKKQSEKGTRLLELLFVIVRNARLLPNMEMLLQHIS